MVEVLSVRRFSAGPRERGVPVLADLSLEAAPGETVVLLGASGSGKTTLLRAIAGLIEGSQGSIHLGDRVLSDPRVRVPPEERGVGMLFQELELWPHMTARRHVSFALPRSLSRRIARTRADELLAEVGLPRTCWDRRPGELSGGEAQRLALARALAPDPHVLLCDEPLSNLDTAHRRRLRAFLRRVLHARPRATVVVSHDPEDAFVLGERVCVLAKGRIVESNAPSALYRAPRTVAGAHALGPATFLRARRENGHEVATALGRFPVGEGATDAHDRLLAFWRPEDIEAVPGGLGHPSGTVLDACPTSASLRLLLDVEGESLFAESAFLPGVGERVGLYVRRPPALVEDET